MAERPPNDNFYQNPQDDLNQTNQAQFAQNIDFSLINGPQSTNQSAPTEIPADTANEDDSDAGGDGEPVYMIVDFEEKISEEASSLQQILEHNKDKIHITDVVNDKCYMQIGQKVYRGLIEQTLGTDIIFEVDQDKRLHWIMETQLRMNAVEARLKPADYDEKMTVADARDKLREQANDDDEE